jgi:hypothetical protein
MTTLTTLRELAQEAYEAHKQETEEVQRERLHQLTLMGKERAKRIFGGIEPTRIEPGYVIYQDDDEEIRLKVRRDEYGAALFLEGDCPNCGRRAFSREIHSLSGLYGQLTGFSPDYSHHCTQEPPPPGNKERIANALERLAAAVENRSANERGNAHDHVLKLLEDVLGDWPASVPDTPATLAAKEYL